jgi:hypothetical protein
MPIGSSVSGDPAMSDERQASTTSERISRGPLELVDALEWHFVADQPGGRVGERGGKTAHAGI